MKGFKIEKHNNTQEQIVYDIEVEDNHNFFTNHILVHNCAVFTAKKKYYARVRDNEGNRYPDDSPKIKVMGLDVIKSGTPRWSKKYLKEAIPLILDKEEKEIRDWIQSIKQEFAEVDLNEIASVGGVSRVDYDLNGPVAVPFGSRAAIRHNLFVENNGIDGKYAPIQGGDKCKRLFLREPNIFNTNIIAYTNDGFINEIPKDIIDYDTQFFKGFMKLLDLMVAPLNYDLEKETADLDDW